MHLFVNSSSSKRPLSALVLFCLVIGLRALAQPVIVSTVPPNGGSVSTNGPVVFTFSNGMDTNATDAQFLDSSTGTFFTTSNSWSTNDTVLTCTPVPPFPVNKMITWFVSGQDTNSDSLGGTPFGSFTTSGGASTGGNGTNKFTTFAIGKLHLFHQASSAAPSADSLTPYDFIATTTLASNRTASSITVTLPTSAVSNLTQNPLQPEQFYLFDSKTNLSAFESAFPA